MIYTLAWLAYGVLVMMIWLEPYLGLKGKIPRTVTETYKDL
jgi:hypothetical protein